jgi:hypothetical protein
MNESTLTQLKVIVERVVRPVRASTSHKRKVREELLAHVNAVFDEELSLLRDEPAALARVAHRLGIPGELTSQLQESVSNRDRFDSFLEDFLIGTGVSTPRLALRYTLLALFPEAFLLIAYYVQGRMAEWPIAVSVPVLAFVSVLLVGRMRDALFGTKGRSWPRVALVSVASWLLLPVVSFASCLTMSGDVRSSLLDVLPLIPVALLAPAALIITACAFAGAGRTEQEWASLQID